MKAQEFAYWLQGLFELADPKTLDEKQTDLIKRHLNMVFIHDIDPSYPVEQQQQLNEAHSIVHKPPNVAQGTTIAGIWTNNPAPHAAQGVPLHLTQDTTVGVVGLTNFGIKPTKGSEPVARC